MLLNSPLARFILRCPPKQLVAEADAFIDDPLSELAREGARRMGGGENSLHLVNPAEMGAADEVSRRAAASSLPAGGVDRRVPGARRPPGRSGARRSASLCPAQH